MRTRFPILAAVAVICWLTLPSPAASALDYYNMYPTANYQPICRDGSPGDTFCRTDGTYLSYFDQASIGITGYGNIRDVMQDGTFANAGFNVQYDSTPVYGGSSQTDVIYQQGNLDPNLAGLIWCNAAVTTIACDQHFVRFAAANPRPGLVCHESGHAVGLTHGYDAAPRISDGDDSLGCVQTPEDQIDNPYLHQHNVDEIQNTYF